MIEWYMKSYHVLALLIIMSIVPREFTAAQTGGAFTPQIDINIETSAILDGSQVLSLPSLGINNEGVGPNLVSATIENLTGETINNLYLEIKGTAGKVGTLVELTQALNRPLSIKPFQTLYFTNNDIVNERIIGFPTPITFDEQLTTEGDNFIENLSGSTTLPNDVYSVEVAIFQVTENGNRVKIAEEVSEIVGGYGETLAFDESEIYLKTPGDIVGSPSEITNPFPQFSWEGSTNTTYRLLVVEQRGQDSPESLLQSAKSSAAVDNGGSLLAFENLDVIVEGTSFQFPSSGAQSLKQGQTYYWRVVTLVQSSGNTEEVSSEIWSFKFMASSQANASVQVSEDVERAVIELIGQDEFQRLKSRGFELESIQYDGLEFAGQAAGIKLDELLQKIRDEEIIVDGN
jgi:hypothetical protein